MALQTNDKRADVGTYAALTFDDYIDVVQPENRPHLLKTKQGWVATSYGFGGSSPESPSKFCRKGGFYVCCINPDHNDSYPSMLVRPGDEQVAVLKCFGANSCDKQLIANIFNKLLIENNKLDLNKQYTRTLAGFAENGVIPYETYQAIAFKRQRRKAKAQENRNLHLAAAAINNQSISFNELQQSQRVQHVQQHQPQPSSNSLADFRKLREQVLGGR